MTRIKLAVYVDLDPVPGTFSTAESAESAVQSLLNRTIGHYMPEVAIESSDVDA